MMNRYKITEWRVVDGDTVEVAFDLGFRMSFKAKCRLAFINAPEGKVTDSQKWLLAKFEQYGLGIEAETHKADKYGRWLVDLFYPVSGGGWQSINREMLTIGLAVKYM